MNHWEEENSVFLAKWANNELTEEERLAFENSDEGKTFLKLVQATDKLELSRFNVDEAYEQFIHGKLTNQKSRPLILRPAFRMALAASLLAIMIVSYLLLKPDYTRVSTSFGESQTVTLPGGSIITLNANSSIKFEEDSWSKERRIVLDGEAFFDVVKGNDFIVKTNEGSVKVLGTSFNIRARDDDLDVVCYTGKVNVSNRQVSTDLTPGNAVRIEDKRIIREWSTISAQQPQWMSGVTELEDTSFDIILQELRNQFNIAIDYDGTLDSQRFKVSFPNTDMEQAIRIVMTSTDVRYTFSASEKRLVIQGRN